MKALLDLATVWEHHIADVLSDEGPGRNPLALSGSDVHACEYDVFQRLRGAERLPRGISTFSAFERGHAYEKRIYDALQKSAAKMGYKIEAYDPEFTVTHEGIPGHPDFRLTLPDGARVVVDATTTASKYTDWKYGHALKSAFYAQALKFDYFVEWVFSIGFAGNIFGQQAHWFALDEIAVRPDGTPMRDAIPDFTWRERVAGAVESKKRLVGLTEGQGPLAEPPFDPLEGEQETWRCGVGSKPGYCDAICPRNSKLSPMKAS